MKRKLTILIVTITILTMLFASGCSLADNLLNKETPASDEHGQIFDEKNDELMLSVVEALESKNAQTLKALLTPLAIEESIDLEKNIEFIQNLYQGTMTDWQRLQGIVETSNNGGNLVERSLTVYTIATDVDTYGLYLHRRDIQTANRNEQGIYKLTLVLEKDMYKILSYPFGGVNISQADITKDYCMQIVDAIEQNNLESIRDLFLPEMRSEVDLEVAIGPYQGIMSEYFHTIGNSGTGTTSEITIPDATQDLIDGFIYLQTDAGIYLMHIEWIELIYTGDTPNERHLYSLEISEAKSIPEGYEGYDR